MTIPMPTRCGDVRIVARWHAGRDVVAKDFSSIEELQAWRQRYPRIGIYSIRYWCRDESGVIETTVCPALVGCDDGRQVCLVISGQGDHVQTLVEAVRARALRLAQQAWQLQRRSRKSSKHKLPTRRRSSRVSRSGGRRRARV